MAWMESSGGTGRMIRSSHHGRWYGRMVAGLRQVIFGKKYIQTFGVREKVIFGLKYKTAIPEPKSQVIFGLKYKTAIPEPKSQVVFGVKYNKAIPEPKSQVVFGVKYRQVGEGRS